MAGLFDLLSAAPDGGMYSRQWVGLRMDVGFKKRMAKKCEIHVAAWNKNNGEEAEFARSPRTSGFLPVRPIA